MYSKLQISTMSEKFTLKITWNVYEINLHLKLLGMYMKLIYT
jgi:hypothetical protein